MIKPDAVRAGNIGNILAMINNDGFRIVAMKYLKLSEQQAGQFYAVHAIGRSMANWCRLWVPAPS